MKFRLKPNVIKLVICLAILAVLISFLPGNVTTTGAFTNSVLPQIAQVQDDGGAGNGLPDQIILSWTKDPKTTQTISWRTGSDTSQEQVQYLFAAGFNGIFDGAREATVAGNEFYDGYYHFEATLRGLTPNTGYVYRVGREGAWSEPASFTTAGTGDRFSFLYMGDVQKDYEEWGDLIRFVIAENPGLKFTLLGGDLVDVGDSSGQWKRFFAAASPVFKQIPLLPAAGNHDDGPLFWKSFALPQNGPEGFKEKFYSFDYGNCHIAVLDSNDMGLPGAKYDEISAWLRSDLDGSSQRWKFLVFHHPPYAAVPDGHELILQEHWAPIFEQCHVDVVFVGHQHVYMRTLPMRAGQVQADGQGIVYIMGNAGTKYYDAGPYYGYVAKELAYASNYEVISIDGDTFTLTAKDAYGQVIDSYMIQKHPVTGL